MAITRRKFVELTALFTGTAMTGLAGALAPACSSDDGTSLPPTGSGDAATGADAATADGAAPTDAAATDSAPVAVQCRSTITQNHGHRITIPLADLELTAPKTYSIIGSSDHDHQITLDATDFAQLKSKLSVKKTSTNGGTTHDHEVTVLCT